MHIQAALFYCIVSTAHDNNTANPGLKARFSYACGRTRKHFFAEGLSEAQAFRNSGLQSGLPSLKKDYKLYSPKVRGRPSRRGYFV